MSKQIEKYNQEEIEQRILTIRGIQVMLDRDIAEMYEVETKVLNQSVKRNQQRFPKKFRFQLTEDEREELVTNCDRLEKLKHSSTMPYAFTEQGVSMLSAVLRSNIAIQVSIQIMDAFVEMRHAINSQTNLLGRMDRFELKLNDHGQKFEKIFNALESGSSMPKQGVYFDGETFDAFTFTSNLIRSAKTSIQLIDSYVDDTVLLMLSKRSKNVSATILTKNISKTLLLDLKKHNEQYAEIFLKKFDKSHDRFLIIDNEKVYHIGASLKDLGKRWFAFTELNKDAVTVIERIKKL